MIQELKIAQLERQVQVLSKFVEVLTRLSSGNIAADRFDIEMKEAALANRP